jgi:hypothetical protein
VAAKIASTKEDALGEGRQQGSRRPLHAGVAAPIVRGRCRLDQIPRPKTADPPRTNNTAANASTTTGAGRNRSKTLRRLLKASRGYSASNACKQKRETQVPNRALSLFWASRMPALGTGLATNAGARLWSAFQGMRLFKAGSARRQSWTRHKYPHPSSLHDAIGILRLGVAKKSHPPLLEGDPLATAGETDLAFGLEVWVGLFGHH